MTSTTPPSSHGTAAAYPFQLARFNIAPVVQGADGDPNGFVTGGVGGEDTSFVFPSSHYVQSCTSEYGGAGTTSQQHQLQHQLAASQLFSAGFLPLGGTTGTTLADQASVESISHESLPGVPHVVEHLIPHGSTTTTLLVPSPTDLLIAAGQAQQQHHAISDGEVASSPAPPATTTPPTGDAAISALGGIPTRNGAVRTAPSGRSLFVSKLDPAVDYIALHQLFAPFGRIVSTRVLFDQISAQSRCIGYVNFADPADAARAVEGLNGRAVPPVQKHPLVVKLADEDSSFTAEETNKIFAKNLPVTATLADVRSLFEKFGKLLSATVHRDTLADPASMHCLMAYVTFEQVEGAVNAVAACHNRVLFANSSQPLIVKLAETISSRERRLGPKSSTRGTPVASKTSTTPTKSYAVAEAHPTSMIGATYPTVAVPTTHIQQPPQLLTSATFPHAVFHQPQAMSFSPTPFGYPVGVQPQQQAVVGMPGAHPQLVYAMQPPHVVVDPQQLRQQSQQPLILMQPPQQLAPGQQLVAAGSVGSYGMPVFQVPSPGAVLPYPQYPGQTAVAMMPQLHPHHPSAPGMMGPMASTASVLPMPPNHQPGTYPMMMQLHPHQQQNNATVGAPAQFAMQYATASTMMGGRQ